jgi:hypothetical protein
MSVLSFIFRLHRDLCRSFCRATHSEVAASFIEFIVVIPFLFFLIFGAVDLGRVLDKRQAATSLATMIAMKTKRECIVTKPFDNSADGPRSDVFIEPGCLDAIFQHSNVVIPNARIIVSLYKLDLSSKVIELWQTATNYQGYQPTDSRYSELYLSQNANMLQVLRERASINQVDKWFDKNALLIPKKVIESVLGVSEAWAYDEHVCMTTTAYGNGESFSECISNPSDKGKKDPASPPPIKPAPRQLGLEPSPYLASGDNNVVVIAEISHSVGALGNLGFISGDSYEVAIF